MPLGVPRELANGAQITRFIHSRRDINPSVGLVKPDAFLPPPDGRTSIAETTGLAQNAIWAMARHTLRPQPGRDRVIARADLEVAAAIRAGLRCMRDDSGFLGHGELQNWPEAKARQKEVALALSAASSLVLAEPPITL